MADATWADLDDVRAVWPDALVDDAQLQALLNAAQEQLEAFAPVLAAEASTPERYKQALIMHVRDLYNASQENGDYLGLGVDDTIVRKPSLSLSVKNLLRPKKGVPIVR